MTPYRIVYVWDADYPWDVRTEKTCLALTRAGHEVHIVARNNKWSPETEQLPEGTVHRLKPWRWLGQSLDATLGFPAFFNPRWYALLAKTIREVRADLVIVRDLPLSVTALHAARRANIPVVLDMAENYPAMMRAIWETGRARAIDYIVRNPTLVTGVEDYCIHRLDHVVVVVEESGDRLVAKGLPPSQITVISNTPPRKRALDAPPRRTGTDPGRPLELVYMGNLEVIRGIVEVITAAARLRDLGRPIRIRLIGKGRDEALMREYAQSLGLGPEHVEFLGYIQSHREALDIVASADIGLMPHQKCEAWDTTIPNKLFDYMALGLPVLSSDAAPCKRIIHETGAGVIFKSKNVDDIVRAITMLSTPEVRARCGEAGRAGILGRYNWEYDTATLLRVVDQVVQTARNGR